ncbi:MAG: type II secretion system protein GspG [Robiginitomaculum sp.]|nr:MAG: type II secretion system protein GspG [Robiginitomaculum sp.]
MTHTHKHTATKPDTHRRAVTAPPGGKDKRAGYSLLEILVVLAIMGTIVTLVAPRLFTQLDRSKVVAAKAQAKTIKLALNSFRIDFGRYPTAEEGLEVLVKMPSDPNLQAQWYGPYLDGDFPADPWGNAFHYDLAKTNERGGQTSPKIVSYGADNAVGGKGLNTDISM